MNAHGSISQPFAPSDALPPSRRPFGSRRRSWYRRPLRVIPVAILAIVLVAAALLGYRTLAAFDTVQSLSTPPPELSGAVLGGGNDLVIDTGPAQEAVRQQGERDPQQGVAADGSAGDDVALVPGRDPITSQSAVQNDSTNADLGADQPAADTTDPEVPPAGAQPEGAAPSSLALAPVAETGGTTILLMGVDARDGESIDVGVRPDALAVLHLDDAGSCRMLAIPRDSRAELPGYGASKINHALAVGGIPYEMQVVQGYLGIEIDHYALVDFAGVTQIVDSVGGIEVDNPAAFTIDSHSFAAGPIQLDGERALLYARYRGGADGDFGRIARQQQVLRAVLDRVREVNLVSLVPRSFSLLADHIRTDLGPAAIVELGATYLDTCTSATLETSTVPGDVALLYDDLMQMELSFVVSSPATIQDEVDWLLSGP